MTTTTNYGMTLLEASQAQKEITINEAFSTVDAMLKGVVIDKDLATPPGSPAAGDAYIVAASPTGAWSGKAKAIAYFNTVWRFVMPVSGMRVWVSDESSYYAYNGAAWAASNPSSGSADASTLTGTTLAAGVVNSSLTSVGTITSGTWNGSNIALTNLAQVSANTVLANPSGSTADISTVGLSASQLIGRGSSGNVAAISLGNGLAMSGASLASSSGAVIASGSFPAAATLDITNIPQTFSHIGILFNGVSCDTATREFQIRASNDNGSSFSSTATDYRGNKQAGATVAAKARATLIEHATGTAASVRTGSLLIFGYRAFMYPQFNFFLNDGTNMWTGSGQLVLSNINALRFMWDASGNFDGGTYSVVGF